MGAGAVKRRGGVLSESGFAGLWDFQDSSRSSSPGERLRVFKRGFRLWGKADDGRIEILKIPPILKILILTKALGSPPAFWIPAFAGLTGANGGGRLVRIRISGIMGFSGFHRRASLTGRRSSVFGWRGFRLWGKADDGRNEIL